MEESLDCAQALRAIGQDLERQDIRAFDIERRDDDFVVWVRDSTLFRGVSVASGRGEKGLEVAAPGEREEQVEAEEDDDSMDFSSSPAPQLRYTSDDVEDLDCTGKARRKNPNGMPNGHSMPQLLRAVGGYVSQMNGRFQAVSWREQSVAVVYDTPLGRRELDVFRPDSIYDIWVGMYVRRNRRNT